MTNPLIKRLPREFKTDFGKYAVIFLFMIMLISLVSGFLVADNSMLTAYNEGFEKYNIEHGLTFDKEPPAELLGKIGSSADITLYDQRYFDEEIGDSGKVTRVYRLRGTVNTECLMSGALPSADNEIAIDRMFADNNGLGVGDTINVKGKALRISGLVALPDYSSLFRSNTDMMFDALGFNVGVMTESGFDSVDSSHMRYCYAWKYNFPYDRNDKVRANELSEALIDTLEDVITEYDEDIVTVQIDALTDKLEKAGEEYGEIYEAAAKKKFDEITELAERGGEEYGELYSAAIEARLTAVADSIEKGAAEYGAYYAANGAAPSINELSADIDPYAFEIIEKSVTAMMTGAEYEAPSEEELISHYIDSVEKPKKTDLSVEVDDFIFSMIENSVTAAVKGEEYEAPSEEEFRDRYLDTVPRPAKEQLSTELVDFLFGIVDSAAQAEINGEEYDIPADEEFEDEIDKSEIIGIEDYLPLYLNKAVNFTGEDMGHDKAMFVIFAYIVIAVLAFIFAVTTSNTIAAEAGVIGTLRASGYSRGELTAHYLILPVSITLIAAVIGNILGYTYFKDVMADMYYGSYSLPAYTVLWNADAFITTTVVPIILMLIINLFVIASKMKLTPLQFLRRELKKNPRKKAFRLNTKIPFISRFKLRIILQNLPGYAVMIFGIILGAAVIIFGDMFGTLFKDYTTVVTDSVICNYQYVLTDTVPTADPDAEKYCMTSFDFQYKDFIKDDVSVYGIADNSRYVSADVSGGRAAVSSTIAAKYGIGAGDTITLADPYSRDKSYSFTVDSVYGYEASLAVFIDIDRYNSVFGESPDYFTGYFSNSKLTDISDDDIAMTVTVDDYTKMSAQMEHSMGGFMKYFGYFGVIMFVLIMYILSKQVIERNFQSISMCKILGFSDGEIGALYIISTSVSAVIGLLAAVPLTDAFLRAVFSNFLYKVITGYFPYNVRPDSFIKMLILGIISYAAVSGLQILKINKVPKGEALKNRE